MNDPYQGRMLQPISSINKYFKQDGQSLIFIGDTLEIRTPSRFNNYGLMEVNESVDIVGIMDLIINDTYRKALRMLAKFTINTTNVSDMVYDNVEYKVIKLEHGDVFQDNIEVIKNNKIVYACFEEFFTRGNVPYWFTPTDLAGIFDTAADMCGFNLTIDRAIVESLTAHLTRYADDKFIQYRHVDPSSKYKFIGLSNVALAPSGTLAKLAGSYMGSAFNASLIHQSKDRHRFEDLLRGVRVDQDAEETTS